MLYLDMCAPVEAMEFANSVKYAWDAGEGISRDCALYLLGISALL